MIYLVRHAHALARQRWDGDDALRPLSARGLAQADAIGKQIEPDGSYALVSSPALRCQATLAPLAERLGATVELADTLAEGAAGAACLADLLARAAARDTVVACTHGDVLGAVLDLLVAAGTALASPPAMPKAGTWELTVRGGRIVAGRLRPPPTP